MNFRPITMERSNQRGKKTIPRKKTTTKERGKYRYPKKGQRKSILKKSSDTHG